MIWLRLALANLWLSPLTTLVNVLLMGLGTASIVLLVLAGAQFAETMSRDAKDIDLVVGAPGSPVQLILSAVYHADIPPGNIALRDAQKWLDDPRVATGIPMSLGDSIQGFRIVGTTPDYVALYGAELATGRIWTEPMEAVLGSAAATATGLSVGSAFAGAHGLADGGGSHDNAAYRVVGVLAPTGTVIDRLVATSLESVWELHDTGHHVDHAAGNRREGDEHHAADGHASHSKVSEHTAGHHDEGEAGHDHRDDESKHHKEEAHDHDGGREPDADAEVTALLLNYRSPLAATTLPRQINAEGKLQAAAPAVELTRVLQLVGAGTTALGAFAWVLVATAALSIFAALYGSLRTRRGELAMLRCLGASRAELLFYLVVEGLLMSGLGVILGFLCGHGLMELVGSWLAASRGVVMTGWTWVPTETWLLLGLFVVGAISATIPAVQAYRTDVARTLAEG